MKKILTGFYAIIVAIIFSVLTTIILIANALLVLMDKVFPYVHTNSYPKWVEPLGNKLGKFYEFSSKIENLQK